MYKNVLVRRVVKEASMSPAKKAWHAKRDLYHIVDSEDTEIFATGNLQELKEWWWKKLLRDREVGGYELISHQAYNNSIADESERAAGNY